MHVDRLETGPVEGRGHFDLAIDALLAQDRHARTLAGRDERRRRVGMHVETRLGKQTTRLAVGAQDVFAVGADRIVAQALQVMRGLGPALEQFDTRLVEQLFATMLDDHAVAGIDLADHEQFATNAGTHEARNHFRGVRLANLQHRARLFIEQHAHQAAMHRRIRGCLHEVVDVTLGVLAFDHQFLQVDGDTGTTGKHHFRQRGKDPAVGTVMVGQQDVVGQQRLNGIEERHQLRRVFHIGRAATHPVPYLTVDRPAETAAAVAQIDEDQVGVAVRHDSRRHGLAHVLDRRERRDHQRQRRGNTLFLALLVPDGFHRQGVLADRNADTHFLADRRHGLDRFVELGIFTGMSCRRHPVGRQFDIAQLTDPGGGDIGQRLGHRHARRCAGTEQGRGRTFAHRHRLATVTVEAQRGHSHVGHRHLPAPYHLVARRHAAHRTVTNGDQEGFVGDGRVTQYPVGGFAQREQRRVKHLELAVLARHVARHARRLAQ